MPLCMKLYCRLEPELLPEMSRESGVKIVAGTAFYVDPLIPDEVKAMSAEEVSYANVTV